MSLKKALIIFAIVEFVVTAVVIAYTWNR